MASQLPTSTSLLTSPTNFQGIPISQLLAALYGDTTTPSSQYAQPVMHSSSASFRKGVDPRNRPKAGGESEAARGSRLIRERRARQAARAEAEKTKAEAAKNTGTIMRTIGGMTGGTVGTKPAPANDTGNIIRTVGGTNEYGGPNISVTTKPAPAREGGFPPLADQVSNRRDLLIPQGPVVDSDPMSAGATRFVPTTELADQTPSGVVPSSAYRAPEAVPVSRTFDDPTLRPEVAAAYARVENNPPLRPEVANAIGRVSDALVNQNLTPEIASGYRGYDNAEAARLGTRTMGEPLFTQMEKSGDPAGLLLGITQAAKRDDAEWFRARGIPYTPKAVRLQLRPPASGSLDKSSITPISSIFNPPSNIPGALERFNPNAVPQPKTFESSAYRTLPSAGSIGADPNTYADRRYDAVEAARSAPRTPEPSFMDWLRSQLPASFSDPRSMYYFPGTYY